MNVLRTIIIPSSRVSAARLMGESLTPAGRGMYTTGLSASGLASATHYVSSGLISDQFAGLLGDPVALFAAYDAVWLDSG